MLWLIVVPREDEVWRAAITIPQRCKAWDLDTNKGGSDPLLKHIAMGNLFEMIWQSWRNVKMLMHQEKGLGKMQGCNNNRMNARVSCLSMMWLKGTNQENSLVHTWANYIGIPSSNM